MLEAMGVTTCQEIEVVVQRLNALAIASICEAFEQKSSFGSIPWAAHNRRES